VEYASDAAEAERILKEGRYDILLLDYKMPGLGGIGVLKMMRAEGVRMKVLIISGRPFVEASLRQEGLLDMVSAVIPKPIEFEALLKAIESLPAS
jgi:DNA-binding response OmpR family regulator